MEGAGNELLGFLRESRPRLQDCSFRIPSFRLRFRKCYEGVGKNRLRGRAVEKVLWLSARVRKPRVSYGPAEVEAAIQQAGKPTHRRASHVSRGSTRARSPLLPGGVFYATLKSKNKPRSL